MIPSLEAMAAYKYITAKVLKKKPVDLYVNTKKENYEKYLYNGTIIPLCTPPKDIIDLWYCPICGISIQLDIIGIRHINRHQIPGYL
jgi:hypothetical protein